MNCKVDQTLSCGFCFLLAPPMVRPPLSIIVASPPNTCYTDDRPRELPCLPTKRNRRVRFEASGHNPQISHFGTPLKCIIALMQAEKHELNPSTAKKTEFSETLDLLKSASAWDKFPLSRFGVDFERTTFTELNTLIKDSRWYDPHTETTTRGFAKR